MSDDYTAAEKRDCAERLLERDPSGRDLEILRAIAEDYREAALREEPELPL